MVENLLFLARGDQGRQTLDFEKVDVTDIVGSVIASLQTESNDKQIAVDFQSGVLLTPRSIGMMAASTITSFSLLRWGYRLPMLIGSITVGIVCVLLAIQPNGMNVLGVQIGASALLFAIVGLSGIGHGTATPASNNACIELMPDKVATITGLRGMFRVLGSSVGVAGSTVVISMVADVQRAYFIVMMAPAVVMLFALPAIFAMPASPNVQNIAVAKPTS